MTVDLLENAQTFLNQALEHMFMTTLDNMSWITKTDGSSVTCTNCIATSMRFHSYAQALQNMIPKTIMTTIHYNAWKCHPPGVLNYSSEEYPAIEGCITDTAPTDISTNISTAGNTLTMIDLDELQLAYDSKCKVLQQQIMEQHTKMEHMLNQLQKTFESQLQQLELKIESNAKQLFNDFRQCFQVVMQKIEELVVDQTEMKAMIKDKMSQLLQAIQTKSSGNTTPMIGNTPQHPNKTLCAMPSPEPNQNL